MKHDSPFHPRARRGRRLTILGGAALCVAVAGCSRGAGEAETAGAPTTVLVSAADVARVEVRRLEAGVVFTGELLPQETTLLIARFDGDIRHVLVREGQRVRRGQTLAVYEPRDMRDADKAAEADLAAAEAQLVAARNAERRAQRLLDAGAASPSDLETASAARAAAEARLGAAQAVRNHARENAERLQVPAPFAGAVSALMVHDGSRTAIGDPIATVVDTDTLELSITVPSEALARVQVGSPIRFQVDAFPGEVFEAQVDRVNPTTEPGTRQVRLYTRVPNPDGRLVGGMFVSGRVIEAVRDSALAAPVAALRREGAEDVVYGLRSGKARRVPVTIGLRDEQNGLVELSGGIAASDTLLTGVLPGIRDGVIVRVLAAGADTAAAR